MTSSSQNFQILVAHGVNLDLLGQREPETYGKTDLKALNQKIKDFGEQLVKQHQLQGLQLDFFQTNVESDLLAKLSETSWDGVLINPAAWTHTSIALADRLKGLGFPYVEVHLSNISAREDFRKRSYSAANAAGVVYGFGANSYLAGLQGLILKLMP